MRPSLIRPGLVLCVLQAIPTVAPAALPKTQPGIFGCEALALHALSGRRPSVPGAWTSDIPRSEDATALTVLEADPEQVDIRQKIEALVTEGRSLKENSWVLERFAREMSFYPLLWDLSLTCARQLAAGTPERAYALIDNAAARAREVASRPAAAALYHEAEQEVLEISDPDKQRAAANYLAVHMSQEETFRPEARRFMRAHAPFQPENGIDAYWQLASADPDFFDEMKRAVERIPDPEKRDWAYRAWTSRMLESLRVSDASIREMIDPPRRVTVTGEEMRHPIGARERGSYPVFDESVLQKAIVLAETIQDPIVFSRLAWIFALKGDTVRMEAYQRRTGEAVRRTSQNDEHTFRMISTLWAQDHRFFSATKDLARLANGAFEKALAQMARKALVGGGAHAVVWAAWLIGESARRASALSSPGALAASLVRTAWIFSWRPEEELLHRLSPMATHWFWFLSSKVISLGIQAMSLASEQPSMSREELTARIGLDRFISDPLSTEPIPLPVVVSKDPSLEVAQVLARSPRTAEVARRIFRFQLDRYVRQIRNTLFLNESDTTIARMTIDEWFIAMGDLLHSISEVNHVSASREALDGFFAVFEALPVSAQAVYSAHYLGGVVDTFISLPISHELKPQISRGLRLSRIKSVDPIADHLMDANRFADAYTLHLDLPDSRPVETAYIRARELRRLLWDQLDRLDHPGRPSPSTGDPQLPSHHSLVPHGHPLPVAA